MVQKTPNILIEKMSLEHVKDLHEAITESSQEWFAEGMLPQAEISLEELEQVTKHLLELWDKDDTYMFNILDASVDQVVGYALLNHVNRVHQVVNLGYAVRISRAGEGIATEAAKLVARYGLEQLGFQRVEIIVRKENARSLRVAEKTGAMREGLLRNRLQLHGSPCDAYMYSLIPADFGIHQPDQQTS